MSDLTGGGWKFNRVLGEGAFGEVHLLVNDKTMNAIAAKIIDINKNKDNLTAIQKEIQIHKSLNHENIIKCYGHTQESNIEYIFLEYACGGELFDRIEPDIGMPSSDAFRYFRQLLNGVEYLHSQSIAHRDLKPENLLLNDQDVVKISDFGTATIFKVKGNYFQSNTMCGTFPYMAPEVYNQKSYWPDKADLWSCGIVLVALLAGELPWDEPSVDCESYRNWKDQTFKENSLWSKIDNLCLSLITKILNRNVKQRYTIADIRNTKWFKKYSNNKLNGKSHQIMSPVVNKKRKYIASQSQPVKIQKCEDNTDVVDSFGSPIKSFSQPAGYLEDMVLSTQCTQMSQLSQGNYVNVYQRLVKRMTRFFSSLPIDETCDHLATVLEKMDYTVNRSTSNLFTVSTLDKRKIPLVFKATVFEMKQDQVLIDFRLSRVNNS